MSINTTSATALVRFTGLGILTFSPRRKRAENLFIHEGSHNDLTIEIYKPLSAEDNIAQKQKAQIIGADIPSDRHLFSGHWYQMITFYSKLDQSHLNRSFDNIGLSIDISGVGNPEIDGYRRYEPGSFDRLDTGDDVDYKDFRWMVNIQRDGIFGDGPLAPAESVDVPTTKLFISNAEFYTAAIAKENPPENQDGETLPPVDMVFKKLPLVDRNADESVKIAASEKASDFGRIGSHFGAAINADFVRVRIAVGDEEHTHLLPRVHRPYVVLIKNEGGSPESDIPIYKKFWKPTDEAFNLLTASEIEGDESGGDMAGAREMCNGVVVEEPESIPPFS